MQYSNMLSHNSTYLAGYQFSHSSYLSFWIVLRVCVYILICGKETKQEETFKLSSKLCSKTNFGWMEEGKLALQYKQ